MEFIYFCKVIILILLRLFRWSKDTHSILFQTLYLLQEPIQEQCGGGIGALVTKVGKLKGKIDTSAVASASTSDPDADKKKGFGSKSMQQKRKGLLGLSTDEDKEDMAGRIATNKMIKALATVISIMSVPFMPFYTATKSFFNNGLPIFKQVVKDM